MLHQTVRRKTVSIIKLLNSPHPFFSRYLTSNNYKENFNNPQASASRHNETVDQKRSRLIYQSRKRGILETDLLLSTFAKKYLSEFTEQELQDYDELLSLPDWDIFYFATEKRPIPKRWLDNSLFKKLQQHIKNEGKVILRMPDL